jgi:ribosomal-protein-alanine N-acetyltransferase
MRQRSVHDPIETLSSLCRASGSADIRRPEIFSSSFEAKPADGPETDNPLTIKPDRPTSSGQYGNGSKGPNKAIDISDDVTPHLADIPVLETKRLRLRAPLASDFEPYAAFRMSDRASGVGGPFTRSEAYLQFGELFSHWILRGFGRWIVADRQSDEPLGVVGLWYPEGWPEPEIAWSVFEGGEGKGIAFEASLAAREFAYSTLGWRTAISLMLEDNPRSFALARRLGAEFEASFQHPALGAMQIWRHPGPAEIA